MAWSLFIAFTVIMVSGSRWRWLIWAHPGLPMLVVAVLVGLGLGHGVWRANTSNPQSSGGAIGPGNGFAGPFGGNGGSNSGSGSSGSSGPSNVSSIAAKASPALVDIDTALSYQGGQAAGTGIVLTSNGVVLTNNHVIAGATRVTATDVGNGRTYTATVAGYDRSHDIAVLELQGAHNLTTATLGNSSSVSVGDEVVGLGNAGGLGGAPSSAGGTVTALSQSITATDESDGTSEQLSGLIQVDAEIQPGDSGGALVDTQGRVIGVDTAASAGFSFQTSGGQGFAIPINQATGIANQIQSGQATDTVHIGPTAFLGVLIDPGNNNNGTGASLARAVAGGPAAQAGLTAGDTITSVAGQTVDSPSTLTRLISKYHPGDKVQVGWTDGSGQSHQATVTLATGPAQ
jgi:S1-C subfamily serine protease